MKITDFEGLINHMPYLQQAFEIKKVTWIFKDQEVRIGTVFGNQESITISRNDLFYSTTDLDLFVIKVLMWGYPTKGRGRNIETLMKPKNFDELIGKLQLLKVTENMEMNEVLKLLEIDGLGLSTLTKILYFLKIKVETYPALILDLRVINAITQKSGFDDDEIKVLKKLTYANAPSHYQLYLQAMNMLAEKMQVKPDQLEMFLYEFGSNLKPLDISN